MEGVGEIDRNSQLFGNILGTDWNKERVQQNGENYLKKVAHTERNGKRDVHLICTKLRQYSTVQSLYMYTVYRPQEKIAAFKQQKINEINQNTTAQWQIQDKSK